MFYPLYAIEFTLSEVEGLYVIRDAIRYKPHAIRDTTTNSYVRNYKPFFAKRTQFPKSQVERKAL